MKIEEGLTVRASSILGKKRSQYGPQHVLEESDDSCWNSDQFLVFSFDRPRVVVRLEVMFQGGFGSSEIELVADENQRPLESFEATAGNELQSFVLRSPVPVSRLCVLFSAPTDFYGRITVYHLNLFDSA